MNIRLPIFLLGAMALGVSAHAQTTVQGPITYGPGQNVTVMGPSTIQTSGPVTVSNGATVTFHASNGIWLEPFGFQTQNGSLFSALITPNVPPTVTPSGPGSITVTSIDTASLAFTATAAGDSIARVEIYRNGVLVATLTGPTSGSTWTFTESSRASAWYLYLRGACLQQLRHQHQFYCDDRDGAARPALHDRL